MKKRIRGKNLLWTIFLVFTLAAVYAPRGFGAQTQPHYLPLVLKNKFFSDAYRKFPYLLYTGSNDSMTVRWQAYRTPAGAQAQIAWGATPACSDGQAVVPESGSGPDEHLFSYTISGLIPGSRTFYKTTLNGVQVTGDFRTAPASGADTVVFYAYGDTRSQPELHDALLSRLRMDLARSPDARQTFLLNGGDFVNEGMSETAWEIEFFDPSFPNTTSVLGTLPILGALGNHEMYSKSDPQHECENPARLFRKYWPYSMYRTDKNFYYSFDYGPVHVSVVDPYTADYTRDTGEQYLWLAADLNNSKPVKIVMFHPPAWSYNRNAYPLRQNLHALFKAKGAQLVVQGHNHYYSRLAVDGITYLTLGGGGAPTSDPGPAFDPTSFDPSPLGLTYACLSVPFTPDPNNPAVTVSDPLKASQDYHFVRFEINGGTWKGTVINRDGTLIDCFPEGVVCSVE